MEILHESIPEKPKRIVVVGDIHNYERLPELVDVMQSAEGDINVTLGDAFDSMIRNELVLDFKQDRQKALDALSDVERTDYNRLISEGMMPVRAYWVARVNNDKELLQSILIEVDKAYEIFAEHFSRLQDPKWLYGNIEQGFMHNDVFRESTVSRKSPVGIESVELPQIAYQDDTAMVLMFPSMEKTSENDRSVESFFTDIQTQISSHEYLEEIVIIAHENLFRGLPPEKFSERMKSKQIKDYFIPFYMPSEYRREILDFLFTIPDTIRVKFVYGHLHDPKETTQVGIPFQDSTDGLGMRWGVNKKDPNTGKRRTRHFDMYQLPYQSIHTIDIGTEGVDINRYER